jgi:hypothetical protein
MRRSLLALAGLLLIGPEIPEVAAGSLSGAIDLEAARANARAGGPNSPYDQDLLRRYGCSSGTVSKYCPSYRNRAHRPHQRRVYRK